MQPREYHHEYQYVWQVISAGVILTDIKRETCNPVQMRRPGQLARARPHRHPGAGAIGCRP
jgi:hypothetical protein